jgi:pilus assembly protein CpaB
MQSRVLAILIAVVLALVATVALVVYVNGADQRAIANQEPVTVWVAVKPITAGTLGVNARNNDLIDEVVVPRKNAVKGAVVSLNQIQNKQAAVDIVPGEQLLQSRWVNPEEVTGRRLLAIPEDHQALSIGLDLTRQVAGFVTPGDHVTMVLSMKRRGPGGGEADRTQFLLQNIQVLAVGATALTNASSQGGGGRVNQRGSQNVAAITLSIPEREVEEVVYAAEHGSIYLTLMGAEADKQPVESRGVTATNVIPPENQ